jgi:hypothetical protein
VFLAVDNKFINNDVSIIDQVVSMYNGIANTIILLLILVALRWPDLIICIFFMF